MGTKLSQKFKIFLRRNLFSLCLLFSLVLHGGTYASYYIYTHRENVEEEIDSETLKPTDIDVDLIEEIPPELLGGKTDPAPVEKKEWVEGTSETAGDPVDEDLNPNAISGTGTDKDGYLYSFHGDKPPTPIIDFDLKQFFPEQAKAANITNKIVVVMVRIDEEGNLMNAKVVSEKAGYGFDEAAIKIIKLARFSPGYVKGKPVKMAHRLPINFTLEDE
ncbi:MAG: energy transducer TonB [Leptospiraceae bacterium]|nr:energy transducer TonB [Leptospiraceae bacterium]MCP5495708.1 energy transducer TonB [Leptospiraceae bacterium]